MITLNDKFKTKLNPIVIQIAQIGQRTIETDFKEVKIGWFSTKLDSTNFRLEHLIRVTIKGDTYTFIYDCPEKRDADYAKL